MDGINNITARIETDARGEAEKILAAAQEEARQIRADYEQRAVREAESLLKKARQTAAERQERLYSLAQLDVRKTVLAAKQELVGSAFENAMTTLTGLNEASYTALLAALAASASRTGTERLILSPSDKDRVGRQVLNEANRFLTEKTAPSLPEAVQNTWIGPMLSELLTKAAANRDFTGAALTLDEETRKMSGGLVLRDGEVETNCSFEVMLRLAMDTMAAEVAQCLFG